MIDRVGPYAVGDVFELGQILVDLPRIDRNIRPERVLVLTERGIRDGNKAFLPTLAGTGASGPWIPAIPTPPRSLQRQSRKRTLQRPLRLVPLNLGNASLIVLQRRCQASAPAACGDFFACLPFPILASRHAAALIIVQYLCCVRRNAD